MKKLLILMSCFFFLQKINSMEKHAESFEQKQDLINQLDNAQEVLITRYQEYTCENGDLNSINNSFTKNSHNVYQDLFEIFSLKKKQAEETSNRNRFTLKMLATYYPEEALIIATRENDLEIIKQLIAKNINLNVTDGNCSTALIIASQNGFTEIVNKLIKAHVKLDHQNYLGETALILALKNGFSDIAIALIEANSNVNLEDCYGNSALTIALENKDLAFMQLLISYNAKISTKARNLAFQLYKEADYNNDLETKLKLKDLVTLGQIFRSGLISSCVIS